MAIILRLDAIIFMIHKLILKVRILVNFFSKITILTKYLDYINIFLLEFMVIL